MMGKAETRIRRVKRDVTRLLMRHPLAGLLAMMAAGCLLALLAVGAAAAAVVIPFYLLGWG